MSRISNSFTVANAIVDLDLRNMSGNALKCYVVIVRKTTGWNKTSDRISISQFQEFAGIAKRDTVGKALRELEEMGLIIRHEKIGKITEYSLNFDEPTHPEKRGDPEEGGNPNQRGMTHPEKRGDTHPDKRGTTKDTMTKDTFNKDTSLSGGDAHAREDAPNDESAPPCPADKPAKRTERAARIPDDFPLTDEMRTWAAEEGCSFDLDREHKKFRDYWTAAGGSKARKMDWIATWRNWMRRADEDWRRSNRQNFGGRHGENQHGHRKLTPVERVQEAQRRRYAQHWDGQPASYGDVEDGQFVEC